MKTKTIEKIMKQGVGSLKRLLKLTSKMGKDKNGIKEVSSVGNEIWNTIYMSIKKVIGNTMYSSTYIQLTTWMKWINSLKQPTTKINPV